MQDNPPMGRDLVIREATEDDVPAVAKIHVDDWRWAYRGLVHEGLLDALSVERREDGWRRAITRRQPGWALFVADRAGTVIGFVNIGPCLDEDAEEGTGEVYALYLQPEVVGTGVGRALFAHARSQLEASGFRRATLWVLADNRETRRFYEAAGWTADGTEKTEDFSGFPLRLARYRIELSS
jgi:L-amino acid N-acyltransferase YncA